MLTFHYIPYRKIMGLSRDEKISKILELVRSDHLIIIEGRLAATEEADLIRRTMQDISDSFTGIEMAVFYDDHDDALISRIKSRIADWLIGKSRGLTLIGPARIIKELKQHPEKVEMHFQKDFR